MVNQQLLDYIKSVQAKGHSNDSIKDHLVKHGYSIDSVNEAFLLLHTPTENPPPIAEVKPEQELAKEKKRSKIFLYIGLALALIVVIILGIFLLSSLVGNNECKDVSVKIHELNNAEVLCVFPDNSKIMTIISNNGNVNIEHVEFKIKSDSTISKRLDNINLAPDQIFSHTLEYGGNNINEISIIPEVSGKSCKPFKIKEIKTC
ncbi:hypothetical protein HN789_05610 [archaeon]|jgi:hypothetical protein|nr:hypothetical protein [archaeon]MBT4022990.1 hypothetical protein [archaeon]MBT4271981.1 hypothetical protein [archaeon]MBT4461819.1 hypothetical protein [archaeon]MBT4858166.1 hypothetical protein [archaeon]